MLERLHDFVALLRQNGLRISPAESVDAARALALVPLEERPLFHAALRATLIKRAADVPLFERTFALFFGAGDDLVQAPQHGLLDQLERQGMGPAELEQLAQQLTAPTMHPLARAMLGGSPEELARLLRQATLSLDFRSLQSPLQRGFYARRLLAAAGAPEAERELAALLAALGRQGLAPGLLSQLEQRSAQAQRALEEAARRIAEREQQARDPAARGETALGGRTLSSLTPQEIERMRDAVRRLAEKLKARLSRRRKLRRKGALSVRRTLRKNLTHGGVPASLVFRTRRPERPEVMVLCDVSDSVRTVSRLMLQFVYTLQAHYARVRSFVFVSELGEVTHLFKSTDVAAAVDLATAGRVINLAANSNYGHALQLFRRRFLASVNRRTTVIVIGDGRSNYNPPEAWILDEIKRKARRLLWLCPEDRAAWGFGDSEMLTYAGRCHRTLSVKSMDDLARAADEVLP